MSRFFMVHCVVTSKWLAVDPLSTTKMEFKVFSIIRLMVIFAEVTENKYMNERHIIVKAII